MTVERDEKITVVKAIVERVYDRGEEIGGVTGDSRVDEQGRWVAELGLVERSGGRDVDVLEGDTFKFAGATWKVAKVYEPTTATRGAVAELTRVSDEHE